VFACVPQADILKTALNIAYLRFLLISVRVLLILKKNFIRIGNILVLFGFCVE